MDSLENHKVHSIDQLSPRSRFFITYDFDPSDHASLFWSSSSIGKIKIYVQLNGVLGFWGFGVLGFWWFPLH